MKQLAEFDHISGKSMYRPRLTKIVRESMLQVRGFCEADRGPGGWFGASHPHLVIPSSPSHSASSPPPLGI